MTSVEEPVCRNCHEGGGNLISPCSCSGSVKWVHRECLDQWRAVSPNPLSFYRCDICHTKYLLRRKSRDRCKVYSHFVLLCLRDIGVLLLSISAVVTLLGMFMMWVNSRGDLDNLFYVVWDATTVTYWPKVIIYGFGTLFFLIGIIGLPVLICKFCCNDEPPRTYSYDTYPYHHNSESSTFWWFFFWRQPPVVVLHSPAVSTSYHAPISGGSHSDSSSSSSSDGDGCGLAILIIILIFVVIGFIVGVCLFIWFFAYTVRKHLALLKKKSDSQLVEVIDLSQKPSAEDEMVVVDIADLETTSPLIEGKGSLV
ncbi:hypothetical protein Pelo_10800 [Pelomyxa schiedti]|nr:hypothetical protein Pelo_10800 [Pelomyxa schiedti]